MKIQQSVCYPMIKPADIPLAGFVAKVAEMGFPAIEFWGRDEGYDEVVALASEIPFTNKSAVQSEVVPLNLRAITLT